MDWNEFLKENMVMILLGALVILLAVVLFLPNKTDSASGNNSTTIYIPKTTGTSSQRPTNVVENPQQLCTDMCSFRQDTADQVKNDDGVLTCICSSGYSRVIGVAG